MPIPLEDGEAVREFVHTEKTFLSRMRVLAKHQANLMELMVDELEQVRVFGNLHAIINSSQSLLERIHAMNGNVSLAFISISRVVQRTFTEYCSSHELAVEIIQRYQRNDANFKRIAEEMQRDEDADGLDIISLLLEPIQRIARYPLLFKQIKDKSAIKAQKESERILRQVNEGIRSEEHYRELEQIASRINLNGMLDLTRPCKNGLPRKLLKKGSLCLVGMPKKKKKRDNIEGFLFNDILLLVDHGQVLYEPFACQELVAIEREDGMELVTNAYGSLQFQGSCAEWVTAINKASECYIHPTPDVRSRKGVPLLFTAKVIIVNVRFVTAPSISATYWTARTSGGGMEIRSSDGGEVREMGLVSKEREKLSISLKQERKFEPDLTLAQFTLFPIVSGQHRLTSSNGVEMYLECLQFDEQLLN